MRHKIFGTLAAYLAVATAFKDASPYLLLSTAEPPPALQESSSRQIQASADILEATKNFLNACPSDTYIIVRQPMVHAEDLSNTKAVPNLRRAMSNKSLRTKFSISEVVGEIDPEEMKDYLVSNCQAGFISVDGSSMIDITTPGESPNPLVIWADFGPLPNTAVDRAAQLTENDYLIHSLLDSRPSTKYTFIYTTTPLNAEIVTDSKSYEPVFIEPLHMELKRQSPFTDTISTGKEKDRRPLFAKYQFFTPGLFMGLLVIFILLAILSVGLSALKSLQVSYGAFDKEMGPAAQKKHQ